MRKVYFVLGLCLLSGCGAENPTITDASKDQPAVLNQSTAEQQELSKKQTAVAHQYREAIIKHQEKTKPIADYITKVCLPKNDKKYISCINEKKAEMIANSLFPDLETKMFNDLGPFEQQLINKKITRKKFTEELDKLGHNFSNQINERATSDIKKGIYTGKI